MQVDEQRSGFETRIAYAMEESGRDAEQRRKVTLRVVFITLFWLVSVSLLVGWGLLGPKQPGTSIASGLAALLAVLLPFVAAVMATKNRQFLLGGVYIVLTLVMVLPALGIAGAGG